MSKKEQPQRDINQIVRYLTGTFNTITRGLERPVFSKKTGANKLYKLQRDFAYLIHEVMVGPTCLLQRNIAACNDFIDTTMQALSAEDEKSGKTTYEQ